MADGDPTSEGQRLINNWVDAGRALENAKSDLTRRECDFANTGQALAGWMLPDDAMPGEQIAVWHGDSLIQVTKGMGPSDSHKVTIRKRGRRGLHSRAA